MCMTRFTLLVLTWSYTQGSFQVVQPLFLMWTAKLRRKLRFYHLYLKADSCVDLATFLLVVTCRDRPSFSVETFFQTVINRSFLVIQFNVLAAVNPIIALCCPIHNPEFFLREELCAGGYAAGYYSYKVICLSSFLSLFSWSKSSGSSN